MGSCEICGKEENLTNLYEGIYSGKVCKVCYECSISEKITLIKRPTREQLEEANKRQSVRELMDKLSSPQQKIMTKDGAMAHKNLSKLKFPGMKHEHVDLVENYDWALKQARRHRKLSPAQLSELSGVDKAKIESLEAGQLFMNFQDEVVKLEQSLGIKILRYHEPKAKILTPQEKEEQIMESVKVKVSKPSFFSRLFSKEKKVEETIEQPVEDSNEISQDEIEEDLGETKYEKIDVDKVIEKKENQTANKQEKLEEDLREERIDFSKRKDLDKITLHDLAELKKKQNSRK